MDRSQLPIPVAEARLKRTVPLVFSLDETCDVGRDGGPPVSDDYRAEDSEFTGTVHSVLIEMADGAADVNHLVDPQLRLSAALARQ
jgi:arylsulfatase